MKRILFLCLTTLFTLTTWAYDFTDESTGTVLYYSLNTDGSSVTLTNGDGYGRATGTTTYVGNIVIPSSVVYGDATYAVTMIGSNCFYMCASVTSITIPSSVTYVDSGAFTGCTSMSKMYFLSATPPEFNGNEFLNDTGTITIYVPIGSVEGYETALSSHTSPATIEFAEFAEIDIVVADSGDDGYATFYHGTYDITLPDGVKAYYASEVKDGEVTLTEVEGSTIPAGNAVLVEGSIADYYMDATAADSENTTTLEGNMLYGSDTDTETTVNTVTDGYYFYKLSTVNGENLGFYWGAEDGGKFEIAAHKAWLAVPTTEGARALSFKKGESDTTGITSLEVENEANAVSGIYTLQGIRVADMSLPGLYIVNGKKVLVK